jgi:large subunit ribosomal protein L6
MSRIGSNPVELPEGVGVEVKDRQVTVKGALGELSLALPGEISASVDGNTVKVGRTDDSKQSKSLHGLSRSLIANMVEGVSKGYRKDLAIEGVGFRAELQGNKLTMWLGYSKPVEYLVPDGIKLDVDGTLIAVSGCDKQLVGDVAARIRSFYPPEPYKGKGVRYKDGRVKRKQGKTVA